MIRHRLKCVWHPDPVYIGLSLYALEGSYVLNLKAEPNLPVLYLMEAFRPTAEYYETIGHLDIHAASLLGTGTEDHMGAILYRDPDESPEQWPCPVDETLLNRIAQSW